MTAASRPDLLRRGYRLAAATVSWNLAEAVIATTAGILAGSVALVGFGVDACIELTSGVIVGWRLRKELRGQSAEQIERTERIAARIAGVLLLGLACYILIDAGRRLLGFGELPDESPLGIGLTAVSMIIMPLLGRAKLRTAKALGSGALRADAYETITCAWLSLTTLVGLSLNAAFGWWWADPAAALVLVPLIVREGLEAWRGECGCHEDEPEAAPAEPVAPEPGS